MAYKVQLIERARADIEDTIDAIDKLRCVPGASSFERGLWRVFETLARFPEAYRRSADKYLSFRGVRVAPVGDERLVFYRLQERRELILDGEPVEGAQIGGCEDIVLVLRVLSVSASAVDLVLHSDKDAFSEMAH